MITIQPARIRSFVHLVIPSSTNMNLGDKATSAVAGLSRQRNKLSLDWNDIELDTNTDATLL